MSKRLDRLVSLLPHGTLAEMNFARAFMLQLNSLEGKKDAKVFANENEERNKTFLARPAESGLFEFRAMSEDIAPDSIFVMSLSGPVLPEDSWGVPGLDTLTAMLHWAVRKEEIVAIVFRLETGGGSAYKLFAFCDELAAAAEVKPVVAHVTGMCASAGVAISTHTTETYADHSSTRIGSIGAAISYLDIIPWFEKEGCKYHYVNAPQNPDKNKVIEDMRQGDYAAAKEDLSELAAEFHSRVRARRAGIDEAALTGKMFGGEKAVEMNIIDGFATLEMAVSRARELANQKSKTT